MPAHFPIMVIRGPSALIFGTFLLTFVLLVLKLDQVGAFPFDKDVYLVMLPIHLLFFKVWFFIINSSKRQARHATRTGLGFLADASEDDDDDDMDDDEMNAATVTDTALAQNVMLVWPGFISLTLRLADAVDWDWWLVFLPFLLYFLYMTQTGLAMGIYTWKNERDHANDEGV